mmetsp:Transcript_16908/g.34805  ORF Transcript_16908/g.34805 Transcript_16908/m.34805 type:complete len:243 (+) Transcript_16908:2194-2922(+)
MIKDSDRQFLQWSEWLVVQQPVDVQHVRFGLVLPDGVWVDFLLWLGVFFLLPFNDASGLALRREIEFVEVRIHDFEAFQDIVVSREVNARVGGVVKLLVEVGKLFERKIGDDSWITSAVHSVRCIGKHGSLGLPVQERIGRRVDSLHLVEDDTFVNEIVVLVVEFQVPSFLGVDHGIRDGSRMENGIGIDRNQVVKILIVLRCDHITGSVGVRESIQKSLKTSGQKLDKRIFGLVFPASTKH